MHDATSLLPIKPKKLGMEFTIQNPPKTHPALNKFKIGLKLHVPCYGVTYEFIFSARIICGSTFD
jgi:hypothetical protein